ncbi:MAG: type II secretion system protein [Lachnospiraceae bacterium]|nr:type II secretion system protein [Lachnospiraceae bacterium]
MKKMRKDNKGFTLVELIVVIVILAILAAILVPALLGYIDKAKAQQVVLNGKSVLTATQADMSTLYAKGGTHTSAEIVNYADDIVNTADVASVVEAIEIGVEEESDVANSSNHKSFTVNYVYYKESGKDAIIFDGSSWDKNNTKKTVDNKSVFKIWPKN